jgi:hypothetical protein
MQATRAVPKSAWAMHYMMASRCVEPESRCLRNARPGDKHSLIEALGVAFHF